ncbi:MAG: hypothetical protein R3F17_07800 [Planctomycetota bacterium]
MLFLLSQISKFQNDVTVSSEIVQLPSGAKAEVRTLYLGISQGHYVTQSGDAAAVGAPRGCRLVLAPAQRCGRRHPTGDRGAGQRSPRHLRLPALGKQ